MSNNQGRSWRPEKKSHQRDTRRRLLSAVGILLAALVGALVYLLSGPAVPQLHFVVVTERGFRLDETALTPLPVGATTLNATRLFALAERFREVNDKRIGPGEIHVSVADFVKGDALPPKVTLVIYCAADAWCVPDPENPEKTVLELLPAKFSDKPVRFSELLVSLKKRESAQTLLLLELTGRYPGLASGAVADDIPTLAREEIKRAAIPGLTLICACDQGERSWEYVAASAGASGTEASIHRHFEGTAFGHFLFKAMAEGNANSAMNLHKTLRKDVKEWVLGHFGETQTVWMVSSDAMAAKNELLQGVTLPKEMKSELVTPNLENVASKEVSTSDSKSTNGKTEVPIGNESVVDDEPAMTLKKLFADRDVLANQTNAAVLYPVEWLQLHTNLLAAERFAMNGNREEFSSLDEDVLRKSLQKLKSDAAELSLSPKLVAIDDWIAVARLTELSPEDEKILKQTRQDFSTESNKSPSRLPDQIIDNPDLRKEFVAGVTRDLKSLSDTIGDESVEAQKRKIQDLVFLIQNLSSRWPQEVFPEQLATIKEVLHGDDISWLAKATKPLVRLLGLRHQALQFAAGKDTGGKLLRGEQWQKIAADIDDVLGNLHAAERWLCIGPDAEKLTMDRLEKAEQSLAKLKEQVAVRSRLTKIQDAQRFQILFWIQYLAMRLEDTSLPDNELAAAKIMAEKAVAGTVAWQDFPEGQLPVGFTREQHIKAMFALTRDFSKPKSEVNQDDEQSYAILDGYLKERLADSASASERLQFLTNPSILNREEHLRSFSMPRGGVPQDPHASASRSGIWTSFWSLRLVDAIEQESSADDWQQWSSLVTAVADDSKKATSAPAQRAVMARMLRGRWIRAIDKLKKFRDSEVFVPEQDVLQLLTKDVTRRVHATSAETLSLYSNIQQTLLDTAPRSEPTLLTVLNPKAEFSAENMITTNVRVSRAAALYVLNNGVTLSNVKTQADRNWFRLSVDAVNEIDVSLELMLQNAPLAATPLVIVAVDALGSPIKTMVASLLPPAENSWQINVVQVAEGKPDKPITLVEVPSRTNCRLPLLPSTLDPATQMHVPLQLKLQLQRIKGNSRSVRIRAIHAEHPESDAAAWSLTEPLVFPDGVVVIDIPFQTPAVPPAAGATSVPGVLDISRGLIFEITPDDLPRKITSRFTMTPRLLRPEEILRRPIPTYDPVKDELTIPLIRVQLKDSTVMLPDKLQADLELSPKLQQYVTPGTSPTLNADGDKFTIPFESRIRNILNEDGLEFGISIAGIPHAWWWKLADGIPQPLDGDRPQIRAFLNVDHASEVQPRLGLPALVLGQDWDKAKLTARVFIHGGSLTNEQQLRLYFLRQGTEASIRATDAPFEVRGRFVETVRITPGENSVWQFSTTTDPYAVAAFTPNQKQLKNGNYDLIAKLEQPSSNEDPITSSVRFTLDRTSPEMTAENVQLNQLRTNINGMLKGIIQVTDPESDVIAVRVGLNPEMMEPLKITRSKQVKAEFKLDSAKGFPKLVQGENDEEETITLYVEAENLAGEKQLIKKPVTFFLPGKAAPMPIARGTIVVKFKSKSPFDVSLSGKGVSMAAPASIGSATFADLEPGDYTVNWKPVQGTLGEGAAKVKLGSGKTETVGPGK